MREEKTLWLGLAALSAIAGVLLAVDNGKETLQYLVLGGIMAVIFWALYNGSKKQYLSFNAASCGIAVELPGDAFAQGMAFIETVLVAKNDRFLLGRLTDIQAKSAGAVNRSKP